jgi:hypothetical protein
MQSTKKSIPLYLVVHFLVVERELLFRSDGDGENDVWPRGADSTRISPTPRQHQQRRSRFKNGAVQ